MEQIAIKNNATSLVHINHNKAFTDSLVIANGCKKALKNTNDLIKKYENRFSRFGRVAFQTLPFETKGGYQMREICELNEDQATFLITLFRNNDIVLDFKENLIIQFRKALNELDRLHNQTSDPAWKLVRDESKLGFKWMAASLKDQRESIGKETAKIHYMNEAKLVNSVITGCFAGIDRNTLPCSELAFIGEIQRYNANLIAQGVSYQERKSMLEAHADSQRVKLERLGA